jgi:FkbM family methyltransferase
MNKIFTLIDSIYIAINAVLDKVRKSVGRDSWLRKVLRVVFQVLDSFRKNPLSMHRWKTNYLQFELKIGQNSEHNDGFVVLQIGACDGLMDDPIHNWIKKYEWRGILVEPQKNEFERLKINYGDSKNLKFENVAIAERDGARPLYKVKDNNVEFEWQRGIASFFPKQGLEQTEIVQCVTFDTLLNRNKVTHVDFLQIDVEGYDYELLKLFNLAKMKPGLIRYEHRNLKPSDRRSCRQYLCKNGYRIMEMEHDTGAILMG